MLFNIKTDKKEQHNLALLEAYDRKKAELQQELMEHMEIYRPEMFENGKVKTGQPITGLNGISSFPGLNTTVFPRDTFH